MKKWLKEQWEDDPFLFIWTVIAIILVLVMAILFTIAVIVTLRG